MGKAPAELHRLYFPFIFLFSTPPRPCKANQRPKAKQIHPVPGCDRLPGDSSESLSSLAARNTNPKGEEYPGIDPQLQVSLCEVCWQSISPSWPRREPLHIRERQKAAPRTFHYSKACIYLLPETQQPKKPPEYSLFYVPSITCGIKTPSLCNTISICNLRPPKDPVWSWGQMGWSLLRLENYSFAIQIQHSHGKSLGNSK